MRNIIHYNRLSPGLEIPHPDTLPILIPDKALAAIESFDSEGAGSGAYEFTEAIPFPAEGTGGVYTGEYFQSLLNYMKKYPIPGDKEGHGEKPKDDFFTIGGMIEGGAANESDSDNGEGICYLRVRVPAMGWESSNEGFIRSLKAGIPELSIVADVEGERGADGIVYYRKELGRPRNDKVDEGAMSIAIGNRKVRPEPADNPNVGIDADLLARALALANSGKIDYERDGEDLIAGGLVCRKVALRKQFNGSDKKAGAQIMNAIARYKNDSVKVEARQSSRDLAGAFQKAPTSSVMKTSQPNGEKPMYRRRNAEEGGGGLSVEEIIDAVKTAILNNQLTLEELTKELSMENKLKNADDEKAKKLIEFVIKEMELPEDATADDVKKAVESLLKESEEAGEALVETEVNRLTGGRKRMNALGIEEPNEAYDYAIKQVKGLRGKRLNHAIDELRRDRVFNRLVGQQNDPYSQANAFAASLGSVAGVNGLRKV